MQVDAGEAAGGVVDAWEVVLDEHLVDALHASLLAMFLAEYAKRCDRVPGLPGVSRDGARTVVVRVGMMLAALGLGLSLLVPLSRFALIVRAAFVAFFLLFLLLPRIERRLREVAQRNLRGSVEATLKPFRARPSSKLRYTLRQDGLERLWDGEPRRALPLPLAAGHSAVRHGHVMAVFAPGFVLRPRWVVLLPSEGPRADEVVARIASIAAVSPRAAA